MKLLEVEGARAPVPLSWRRHCTHKYTHISSRNHHRRLNCVSYGHLSASSCSRDTCVIASAFRTSFTTLSPIFINFYTTIGGQHHVFGLSRSVRPSVHLSQRCGVLIFLWDADSDSDSSVKKFRTPARTSGPKSDSVSDSRSYCVTY